MPTFLPGAEPFAFDGNEIGCLLVHGFTGTPYEMRQVGEYLSREFHFTIICPALAGHGTHHTDLHHTTWRDWYATVQSAYTELTERCGHIFAIGLSLGGVLVLHLAYNVGSIADSKLRGIVPIAAPIYVNHPLSAYFRALPILHRVIPFLKKDFTKSDAQDPSIHVNRPGYTHDSTLAGRSLILDLLPTVRAELESIHTPTLLIQSHHDRTIPGDSMPIIYNELGALDKEKVWLDRGGHLVLEDYGKAEAFQLVSQFISQHLPLPLPIGLQMTDAAS